MTSLFRFAIATIGLLGLVQGASFANTGACRPGLERPPGHPNAFCRKPVGTLSGFAFLDTNDNDRKDPGEKGIPGIVITIENEAGRKVAVRTNRNGRYTIRRLRRAPYKLNVRDDTIPLGVTLDNEDDVTLRITPFIKTRYDFCFKPVIVNTSSASTVGPTTNSISVTPTQRGSSASVVSTSSVETTTSTTTVAPTVTIAAASTLYNPSQIGPSVVYLDGNNNQIYDDNDTPIPNVDVTLLNKRGEIVATTTTNVNGTYVFPNLAPGIYTVKVDTTTVPAGYISIRRGAQYTTVLGEGQTFTNGNFCFEKLPTATIGPAPVFVDTNGNDVQDADESGVPNVMVVLMDDDAIIATTMTDANGNYEFKDLVPGTYTVRLNVTTIPANTTPQREKFTVTLKPGQTFAGAQASFCLKPRPKSEICGTITKDGAPLGNVTVILTDSTGKEIAIIKTDASGDYVFPKVNAGTYTVTVDKSTLPAGVVSVDGSDGKATVTIKWGEIAEIDFKYKTAYASIGPAPVFIDINGNDMQDADESGVPNVMVVLMDDDAIIATTMTDANGNYEFKDLVPGTYTARLNVTTIPANTTPQREKFTVTLKPGQTFAGAQASFCLKPRPKSEICGTITKDGAPLGNVTVILTDSTGKEIAIIKTDASGDYVFPKVNAGTYTVTVDKSTLPAGIVSADGSDGKATVTVKWGEIAEIDFKYKTAYASIGPAPVFIDINGNDMQDADESGVPNVMVVLMDDDAIIATTMTDANGNYEFKDLVPGTYTVRLNVTTIPANTTPQREQFTVTLKPGQTFAGAQASFCLKPRPKSEICGTITKDGAPLGNVTVILTDSTGKEIAIIKTDASGNYVFPKVNAGTYTVTVDKSTLPAGVVSADGSDGKATVTIKWGEIAEIDFKYKTAYASIGPAPVFIDINGNDMQDADEPGVPNVIVFLMDDDAIIATTMTDANGNYEFKDLVPGTYTVRLNVTTIPANTTPQREKFTVTLKPGQTFAGAQASFCLKPRPKSEICGTITKDDAPLGNVTVILTDSTGKEIAIIKTDASGNYVFPKVNAGTYTVTVDKSTLPAGVVSADGSDGKATVTVKWGEIVEIDFKYKTAYASIGPAPVFIDTNGNDVQDADESGVPNVMVVLMDDDAIIATTMTDANGNYEFKDLVPGTYTVRLNITTIPANTTPQREQFIVTLQPGQTFAGAQASFCLKPRPKSEICGTITKDDAPLGNVTVILTDSTGKEIAITKTDASGDYVFPKVNAGTYTVTVEKSTLPAGIVSADGSDGKATVTVKWDEIAEIDFKYKTDSASIGPNTVFIDNNGNDKFDGGDKVLSGVTVNLLDSDGNIVATTKTDDNGKYGFTNITPGLYTVKVDLATVPKGIKPLRKDGKFTVVLAAGEHFTNGDFCFVVSVGTIRAYVFEDSNKNTIRDDNDIVLPNVVVNLVDSDNKDVATTKTDEKGLYIFTMVNPGTYIVRVDTTTVPSGLVPASGKPEAEVTVVSKKTTTDADIVFIKESVPPGKIEGRVWHDDYPGDAFEYGDYGLMNVKVTLYDSTGTAIISTTTTDMRGFYKFLDVAPGKYIVKVDTPRGHTAGKNDNVVGVDGQASVTVTSGETVKDIEFAYIIDYGAW